MRSVGDDLIEAMSEALAIERGEKAPARETVVAVSRPGSAQVGGYIVSRRPCITDGLSRRLLADPEVWRRYRLMLVCHDRLREFLPSRLFERRRSFRPRRL